MERLPTDDASLVAGACHGDLPSYEQLVRLHQGLAFRAAYLVLGDAQAAEDTVQEAFFKAYRGLHSFHQDRPFRPWLLRIVMNEALNALKAGRRRASVPLPEAAADLFPDPGPSPEGTLLESERRREVLAALFRLSDKDRLIIHLRYFMDLSEVEMAEVLRCRRGTVKSRLSRAMERLRGMVKERFPELEKSLGPV